MNETKNEVVGSVELRTTQNLRQWKKNDAGNIGLYVHGNYQGLLGTGQFGGQEFDI